MEADLPAARGSGGCKPAAFVEFLVVGNERFGDHAQDPAALDQRCTVKELVVDCHRQADYRQTSIACAGSIGDLFERGQGTTLQGRLLE
jgi:hypothetical protein